MKPANGQDLIEYWEESGVIGSRSDIKDSQEYAEALRHLSQTHEKLGRFGWILDLTVEQANSLVQLKNVAVFFVVGAAIAGFFIGLSVGLLL